MRAVNLISGKARSDDGTKAELRVDANTLVRDSRKSRFSEIPFWSITGLSRDPRVRNKGAAYAESLGSCDGMACPGDLAIMAALAPFSARWEYVTTRRRDNGVPRTSLLRGRGEATRRSTAGGRAARKSEAIGVRLDRGTFIRNGLVRAGLYQALVLERQSDSGNLYLFRGEARSAPHSARPYSR